jgi:hypothetical protein
MSDRSVIHLIERPKSTVAVIPFPKAVPRQISQADIEEVIFLRNQQEHLAGLEADLLRRLRAGASVEEGVHTARPKLVLDVR